MSEMFLSSRELEPRQWDTMLYAQDTRELTGDQAVKMQFTGPGSEVVLQQGPPAGKKWRVFVQVQVCEGDV